MFSQTWYSIGFIRWPLSLSFVAVISLAGWSAFNLSRGQVTADPQVKVWIDAILFWGGFSAITGVLGTLVGIVIASQAIEAAGEVTGPLVWGGIKVAVLSSIIGIVILALSAILWFVLQFRWRLLDSRIDAETLTRSEPEGPPPAVCSETPSEDSC